MSDANDDLQARIKRFGGQPPRLAPTPARGRIVDDDSGVEALIAAVLRPQLAFLLGAVAMVAGRAFAMNYLMIEPSTEVLGLNEGAVILVLLVGIGLLLGRREVISHGAMVVGASLAFLMESFYLPLAPDLMGSVYTPEYVSRVLLGLP